MLNACPGQADATPRPSCAITREAERGPLLAHVPGRGHDVRPSEADADANVGPLGVRDVRELPAGAPGRKASLTN